jgi:hypothetical protein
MSVLMPELHCFDYCSFVVSFEVGLCETFFFKIALAIQGPLKFHVNFRINFFYFCKNHLWHFDRECFISLDLIVLTSYY